jgi:hypothetical protein
MTSLLARNRGKRWVVSGIAGEFGRHGESVDGAFDDCFAEGWLRAVSVQAVRAGRAALRQARVTAVRFEPCGAACRVQDLDRRQQTRDLTEAGMMNP